MSLGFFSASETLYIHPFSATAKISSLASPTLSSMCMLTVSNYECLAWFNSVSSASSVDFSRHYNVSSFNSGTDVCNSNNRLTGNSKSTDTYFRANKSQNKIDQKIIYIRATFEQSVGIKSV